MSCKRSCEDPDYVENLENDRKRLKAIEKSNVDATVKKIEKIIETQFLQEIKIKEAEIEEIDDRIFQARQMLDQLRAGIVISYYSFDNLNEATVGRSTDKPITIHHAVKKILGKLPLTKPVFQGKLSVIQSSNSPSSQSLAIKSEPLSKSCDQKEGLDSSSQSNEDDVSRLKIKKRIIVGNVSQWIPVDSRDGSDLSTHRWMVYVRGPKEDPSIHSFVSKVRYFLHPSYQPGDVVDSCQPPFCLKRRGWGEFPVRVQLHFRDTQNKAVDIIHSLKLDTTHTGLQTLGAETVVDVQLFKEDCGIHKVRVQQPHQYPIPDIGGISIPAEEETKKNDNSEQMHDKMVPIKKEIVDDENSQIDRCSVSSFMNDHGTYANHNPNVENVRNHIHVDFQQDNETGEKLMKIKQEPPDYVDTDDVPTQTANKIVSSVRPPGVSLLNSTLQLKNSSILRKDIGINQLKNVNSLTGKTTTTLIVNANKSGTTTAAVSILNCNQKNSGHSASSTLKLNAAQPVTITFQKGTSSSTSTLVNNEAKLPLRGQSESSTQSTDTGGLKESEQKVPIGNGVTTFVKCTDKDGKVYFIPWSGYLKMYPNAQNNLVRLTSNIQNGTVANSSEPVNNSCSNLSHQSVETELKLGDQKVGGLKRIKITSINEASVLLSKSNSENTITATLPGISKLKCTPTTNSSNKQMMSLLSNQTFTNNVKAYASSESPMSINIDDYDDFSYVVRYVGKKFPLIVANPDRSSQPYCAPTMEEFFSWNVGKRHAAEWHRAKAVKDKLTELIEKSTKWRPVEMWTIKQLYVWFRSHGYTPIKNEITNSEANEPSFSELDVCTLSDGSCIIPKLSKECGDDTEDTADAIAEAEEEIDVITVENPSKSLKKANTPEKLPKGSVICLPLLNKSTIVQETCREIGINLQVEELCSDVVGPLAVTALSSVK
ncbi:YEATS domain-containing protein 2, variant 2 [Chamberlinius hualienensis]